MDRSRRAVAIEPHPTRDAERAPGADPDAAASGSLFGNRNFRLFFIGQLISNTGNWLQLAAQAVLVKQLSGSSFAVGMTTAALFVPVWIFALPGGRLADAVDRRRVLVAMEVLAMGATAVLAVLAATGHATVAAVVVVALLVGVQFAVSIPTMMALLPALVERRQIGQAIGMNSITYNIARALGPALATAIIATLGFGITFALNALSFVALIAAVLMLRPRATPQLDGGGGSVREALAYAWSDRRLRAMLAGVASVAIASAPVVALAPTFARDVFGERAADAGLLISGFGTGAIAGALMLTRAFRSHGRARFELLVPAGVVLSASLVAFALSPSLATGAICLGVAGLGFIASNVTWTTGVQQAAPEHLRGRIMGIWTLAYLGVWPIAAPVGGAIADLVSPRAAVLVMALPVFVVALIGVRVIRRDPSTAASR
jgi:MFS family permease